MSQTATTPETDDVIAAVLSNPAAMVALQDGAMASSDTLTDRLATLQRKFGTVRPEGRKFILNVLRSPCATEAFGKESKRNGVGLMTYLMQESAKLSSSTD